MCHIWPINPVGHALGGDVPGILDQLQINHAHSRLKDRSKKGTWSNEHLLNLISANAIGEGQKKYAAGLIYEMSRLCNHVLKGWLAPPKFRYLTVAQKGQYSRNISADVQILIR